MFYEDNNSSLKLHIDFAVCCIAFYGKVIQCLSEYFLLKDRRKTKAKFLEDVSVQIHVVHRE